MRMHKQHLVRMLLPVDPNLRQQVEERVMRNKCLSVGTAAKINHLFVVQLIVAQLLELVKLKLRQELTFEPAHLFGQISRGKPML